ncbi:hypothetical protein [Methylobrevis pamukkalensis]|uniref:Uncharacterized protein n=1 Tax=Methylobrevis pamukkalensis TaxID=1439726 RepID=A0A1E3GWM1_9HYPH|nr:hypothetical protein [Methylobrevis pamukkalensis]ODN68453.1 hypothetical protein A6302_04247 [Methylobrevis pamukkalensis]
MRADAVYGRSLALFAAGDVRGATLAATAPEMTAARRDEVGVAVLSEQAIAAFTPGAGRRPLPCSTRAAPMPRRPATSA